MPRWLRITRFYRSVPALDRVSDERCETLTAQAIVKRGDAIWIVPGGLCLLIGLVQAGFGHMVVTLVLSVATGSAGGTGAAGTPQARSLAVVLELMNLAAALSVMIIVFVVVRRVMLIRTMVRILNRAVCPYCDFSLVGLVATSGRVKCPECGQSIVLAEHRLTEDDLIPDTPEGMRAMRERWKKQGADRYGALERAPVRQSARPSVGTADSRSSTQPKR